MHTPQEKRLVNSLSAGGQTWLDRGFRGPWAWGPAIDNGTMARTATPPPSVLGGEIPQSVPDDVGTVTEEERLLAAGTYGEGSTKDVFEEMAAIASVMVRQAKARGYTSLQFLQSKEAQEFSFVLVDGNTRFDRLMNAMEEAIGKDSGMNTAVKAARHAITGLADYSNESLYFSGQYAGCYLVGDYTGDGRLGYVQFRRFFNTDHDYARIMTVERPGKTRAVRAYDLRAAGDGPACLVAEPLPLDKFDAPLQDIAGQ